MWPRTKAKGYRVLVDDNFHFMDECEEWDLGRFDSLEAAVAACKQLVDGCLTELYRPRMSAAALDLAYCTFGGDPWIAGADGVLFSTWTYASAKAKERCEALARRGGESRLPGAR